MWLGDLEKLKAMGVELQKKTQKDMVDLVGRVDRTEKQNKLEEMEKRIGQIEQKIKEVEKKLSENPDILQVKSMWLRINDIKLTLETLSEGYKIVVEDRERLNTVVENVNYLKARVEELEKHVKEEKAEPLTDIQTKVLELRRQGLKQKQIANELKVSHSYISRILKTLRIKGYDIW